MCPLKFCTLDCSHLVGFHAVLHLAVTGTKQNIRICAHSRLVLKDAGWVRKIKDTEIARAYQGLESDCL